MLLQLWLVSTVKPQTTENGDGRNKEFENRDPEMRKMYAVGLSAVLPYGKGDDRANPDDDARGDELQNAEPNALDFR